MHYLHLPPKEIVVVGDQIFTDVLGANAAGMKSILLTPKDMEHSFTFRVRRKIESPIRRRITNIQSQTIKCISITEMIGSETYGQKESFSFVWS